VDSVEIYGETVVNGDPTWAGPLAGVAMTMKIPVYHVLEQEITAQIDPELHTQHLAVMEMALNVEEITSVLKKIRAAT
jgi:betaine reductase